VPGLLGALTWVLAVQAGQAAVAGTIRDGESGAPLEGAVVTLTDADIAAATAVHPNREQRRAAAGPQHLAVKCLGYEPRVVHALVPGDGLLRLDLSLRPRPLQLPTIVVRSAVVMRGLEDLQPHSVLDPEISAAALRNHPMLAELDGFLALTGGAVSAAPEAATGLHLRGGAADHTAYLLDGVPVFSPYHAAGIFSAWNPDALEAVRVQSSTPSLAPADALAGAVVGTTRPPGPELRTYGALSTSQGRLTLHGPLGHGGAGFLLSMRSGFPGIIAPADASYLQGRTGDLLAKVETPALRGRLRLLLYDSGNRLDAAAADQESGGDQRSSRNGFEWESRSAGLTWTRTVARGTRLEFQGWNARGEAEAGWNTGARSVIVLESDREDQGLLGTIERTSGERLTGVGARVQRSRTTYRAALPGDSGTAGSLGSSIPLLTLLAHHKEPLAAGLTADAAMSATAAAGALHLGPRLELRWNAAPSLAVSASFARSHQFAQSLRNSESVVGAIFPADLFLGTGAPGVPVARSDRLIVGAHLHPIPGVRFGAQAYAAGLDGLVLVAPRNGEPFSTRGFATGRGWARGLSLESAASGQWYGMMASWAFQHVRATHGDSSYTPGYASGHLVELGVVVFPAATTSLRLAFTGELDRRGTDILGGFEWESCNLLDQGCEFAGSPLHDSRNPGSTPLPDYFRLDLGVRKHWHIEVGGRDVELGMFGTVTNLFGRRNVLAFATDLASGKRTVIAMRPLAPLVVGLDWRF